MSPNNAPCKGCAERYTACHDRCERYAQWKAEVHKAKATEREYIRKRREDFLMSEECVSAVEKWRLRKRHDRQ